jgi:hypothetical protein
MITVATVTATMKIRVPRRQSILGSRRVTLEADGSLLRAHCSKLYDPMTRSSAMIAKSRAR